MNSDTPLHRQIHPNWIDSNDVSSQVFEVSVTSQSFTPTPKDEGKLSVANGEKITAEQSYQNHVAAGHKTVGVLTVLGKECEQVELPYEEDNDPFDGHSFIDYTKCTGKSDIKNRAKKLKAFAISRGWTYSPPKTEIT